MSGDTNTEVSDLVQNSDLVGVGSANADGVDI
jgi:hypothetical protein